MWSTPVVLPTYLPEAPDRYPAYLDKRVYQGSSGRVFPLPFHDRISETPADHAWAVCIWRTSTCGCWCCPSSAAGSSTPTTRRNNYPLFYANSVIKPALVGLAGPWLAGGVEFNWPQHHRPATFLPDSLGDRTRPRGTVWCSDHDPFARMKGMHGVRLQPGSTVIEFRVRLFNRSDEPQTFLWWANVAGGGARRLPVLLPRRRDRGRRPRQARASAPSRPRPAPTTASTTRPARTGHPAAAHRVPGTDWTGRATSRCRPPTCAWIRADDFFGGYDHRAGAGFVHWADHHYRRRARSSGPGATTTSGTPGTANLADDGLDLHRADGRRLHRQPARLLPPRARGDQDVLPVLVPVAGTGPAVAANLDVALGVDVQAGRTTLRFDATHAAGSATLTSSMTRGRPLHRSALDLRPERTVSVVLDTSDAIQVELLLGAQTLLRWSTPLPHRDADQAGDVHPARARRAGRDRFGRGARISPGGTWSSTGTPPALPSRTGPRLCPAIRVTHRRTPRWPPVATAKRAIATPNSTCGGRRSADSLNPNPMSATRTICSG